VTITSRTCPGCDAAEARRFGERNTHLILRCERCATLYTIDGIEHTYEGGYACEPEAPPFLARRFDDIVARFDSSRRNGRLLDIGFGAGDLLGAARGNAGPRRFTARYRRHPHELLRRGRVTQRERLDSAYALNAFFEEHRGRRFVKRLINRALSITRLGDSLKVFAQRA